jgi:dTDP-4-amino-4,6-dideoxygalactose transaminase
MSSFCFPFIFSERNEKKKFQKRLWQAGIESRSLISGNLLHQPFLKKYYNSYQYPNADFLHTNAFYIGNNQFVDKDRLDFLDDLMSKHFD